MSAPRTARLAAALGAAAAACAGLASCHLPGFDEPSPFFAAFAFSGTWQWAHLVDEPSGRRLEREEWRWIPGARPGVVHGHYLREVTVRTAGEPFACNQDRVYTQRAWYEVEARAVKEPGKPARHIEIVETAYRTEPSPCDHGFRKLGRYLATVRGDRAVLIFPEGRQTLWRTDATGGPLPVPWETAPAPLSGAWRWESQSLDEQGHLRREDERWELALTDASFDRGLEAGLAAAAEHTKIFDGVYTRTVTVQSRDGSLIPCAGAPSYGFEDRYVVTGKRRGPLIAVKETASAAGQHPCLRDRPRRDLDSATLELEGAHLVLDWRGKRRQVLHR